MIDFNKFTWLLLNCNNSQKPMWLSSSMMIIVVRCYHYCLFSSDSVSRKKKKKNLHQRIWTFWSIFQVTDFLSELFFSSFLLPYPSHHHLLIIETFSNAIHFKFCSSVTLILPLNEITFHGTFFLPLILSFFYISFIFDFHPNC